MGFVATVGALLGCLVMPGVQLAAMPSPISWAWLAATTAGAFAVQASAGGGEAVVPRGGHGGGIRAGATCILLSQPALLPPAAKPGTSPLAAPLPPRLQCMFTSSVRRCNASTAASLDYLSLVVRLRLLLGTQCA